MADAELVSEGPVEIVIDHPQASQEQAGDVTQPVADKKSTETQKAAPTEKEAVEDLRSQIAQSRAESARRLAEKDRVIAEALARAQTAEKEVVSTQKTAIDSTIDRLNAEKDAAKRDLAAAHEAGDWAKIADAQERIATAVANIVEAKRGKLALEDQERQPQRREASQPDRQPQYDGAVSQIEQFARQAEANGDQRSAAWLRSHPEFEGRTRELTAAHNFATARGASAIGSPDQYFQLVEQALGIETTGGRQVNGHVTEENSTPNPQSRQEREHQQQQPPRSPVAAPVRRDAIQTATGRVAPKRVTLSQGEQQAARETFGPLYPNETDQQLYQRYAQRKSELMEEGVIS
jgi:hypothetical protein